MKLIRFLSLFLTINLYTQVFATGLVLETQEYTYTIAEPMSDQGAWSVVYNCQRVNKLTGETDEVIAKRVSHPLLQQSARQEIEILKLLNRKEEEAESFEERKIVKIFDTFFLGDYKESLFILEPLSNSLSSLLDRTSFKGVSLELIRRFALQTLETLNLVHSLGIVHGDIKPKNILLRNPRKNLVSLIDFGSAFKSGTKPERKVAAMYYRAPEAILDYNFYNTAVDVWALGCVLLEMHFGFPLFWQNNGIDMLINFVRAKGNSFELRYVNDIKRRFLLEEITEQCCMQDLSSFIYNNFIKEKKTRSELFSFHLGEYYAATKEAHLEGEYSWYHSEDNYKQFFDFISIMLEFDPTLRPSAKQLLYHGFLKI
jgi:dual specificity tyrosine-phosphorylation-regulated kinase 1